MFSIHSILLINLNIASNWNLKFEKWHWVSPSALLFQCFFSVFFFCLRLKTMLRLFFTSLLAVVLNFRWLMCLHLWFNSCKTSVILQKVVDNNIAVVFHTQYLGIAIMCKCESSLPDCCMYSYVLHSYTGRGWLIVMLRLKGYPVLKGVNCSFMGKASLRSYGATVLPDTKHSWTLPTLTQARQAGTQLLALGDRMLSWPGRLVIKVLPDFGSGKSRICHFSEIRPNF